MKPSEMDLARWRRVDELFDGALDQPVESWPDYLERACGPDEDLRTEVEALLRAHRAAEALLERSAAPLGARALEGAERTEPLRVVGPFRVTREIGRGGMGVVYLAEDSRLGRAVALKVLQVRGGSDTAGRARFLAEARAISALDHPNVATLYEIGTTEDRRPFLAFAYYAGETLDVRIRRGPLSLEDALEIAEGIARGLGAAHRRDIVHGDVKPSNVILTEAGGVKLLDFGVARVAGDGSAGRGVPLGTLAYMSPEQVVGVHGIDQRSDLWALGVVLYEMLTGERPFRGPDRDTLSRSILERSWRLNTAEHPGLLEVGAVLERLLEKDPARRYPHVHAVLEDLRPIRTRATSRIRSSVAAGLLVLAVAAGGWLALTSGPDEAPGSGDFVEAPAAGRDVEEALRFAETHLDRRSAEGIELAGRYFQRALSIDPSSAEAMVGLAKARLRAGSWGLVAPADAYPEAKALAESALRVDSSLAQAYAALAEVSIRWEWDLEAGRRFAQQAMELDEETPAALGLLGQVFAADGAQAEARAATDRANELRRQPPTSFMARAVAEYLDRRFEAAIRQAEAARAFDSGIWQAPWMICLSRTGSGHAAAALGGCEEARSLSGDNAMAVGAHAAALAASGRRDEASLLARELELRSEESYVPGTAVAWIHGALGDMDRAFEWMERAFQDRDASLIYLARGAFFDPLRSDPRFAGLLTRHWRRAGG